MASSLLRSVVAGGVLLALSGACSSDSEPTDSGTGAKSAGGSAGAPPSAGSTSGGQGTGGTAGQSSGGKGSTAGAPAGGQASAGEMAGGFGGDAAGAGGEAAHPPAGKIVEECLDAPVLDETRTEALLLHGSLLVLGIVRRADPDGIGTSGTTPWLPQRFGLELGTIAACASGDDLDYVASHHNFDDQMSAVIDGDTWIFRQTREDYDKPTRFTLERRSGDALAWGPIALTLVSCDRLDTQTSCTDSY